MNQAQELHETKKHPLESFVREEFERLKNEGSQDIDITGMALALAGPIMKPEKARRPIGASPPMSLLIW